MKDENLRKLSKNLVTNNTDFMRSFRHNLLMYVGEKDISIHDIAEEADISFETLKSLIYGDSKDCKLSTAVALAKALGVSVDELVGADTIEPVVKESISITRNLPDNYVHFVRWAIRYYERMLEEKKVSSKAVNVMLPVCSNEGNIVLTNNFEVRDISKIKEFVRPKVFMGIKLPSDAYMPIYAEEDILLIANDRLPMPNENSVIIYGGFMWLAKRRLDVCENGEKRACFYSIRDGKFRVAESDIEELIGYVADVCR